MIISVLLDPSVTTLEDTLNGNDDANIMDNDMNPENVSEYIDDQEIWYWNSHQIKCIWIFVVIYMDTLLDVAETIILLNV